ncbi:MAG: hypothetical protein ABI321_01910, partial [Polyangia bacterium]
MNEPSNNDTLDPEPSISEPPPGSDEFAGIEPAPARRSPILAASIIALAAFTLFHLRHDLGYALSPRTVVPLSELSGTGTSAVGRYVEVTGVPDRHDSLFIEPRGDKARESLFRLLDSDPPLFVRARDTSMGNELTSSWKGRLQRFGEVGWASSIRDYYEKTPQQSLHAIDLASLRGHLADHAVALSDRRGHALPIDDKTEVVVVDKPSEYALYMSREKFPKKDDATRELARVLASRPSTPAPTVGEDTPDSFVFFLPFEKEPAKQNELMGLLQRENVELEAHAKTRRSPLGTLAISDWDAVSEVHIEEPLTFGSDALVLTEGESP